MCCNGCSKMKLVISIDSSSVCFFASKHLQMISSLRVSRFLKQDNLSSTYFKSKEQPSAISIHEILDKQVLTNLFWISVSKHLLIYFYAFVKTSSRSLKWRFIKHFVIKIFFVSNFCNLLSGCASWHKRVSKTLNYLLIIRYHRHKISSRFKKRVKHRCLWITFRGEESRWPLTWKSFWCFCQFSLISKSWAVFYRIRRVNSFLNRNFSQFKDILMIFAIPIISPSFKN